MPFPFVLPTTSSVDFSHFFGSATHPSLPTAATSKRSLLKDALKRHKRLPDAQQGAHLSTVLSALELYIPYLLALDAGLSGGSVKGEEIDIVLLREVEVEWRPTLTDTPLGREPPRTKLKSLDAEIFFVLEVYAYVQTLLARDSLRPIYVTDAAPMSETARAGAIAKAMRHLLDASAVHKHLTNKATTSQLEPASIVVDISSSVLSALSSLALAEATVIAVLKDDPYPVAVADDRNKASKDWMFKAPDLKTARLNLLVRICMGAAEHAGQAVAPFRSARSVDDDLISYVDFLRRTARAKAARFQAIVVEAEGKTGEALGWIRGAQNELGLLKDDESKASGLSKLKRGWQEKREESKVKKGDSSWGSDAGRLEEGRVLDMLEKKWTKMNDTYSMQIIPASGQLMANLPSGRDFHKIPQYIVPTLGEDILVSLRGPPDPSELHAFKDRRFSDDSGSDGNQEDPVGAFPGTAKEYSSTSQYY